MLTALALSGSIATAKPATGELAYESGEVIVQLRSAAAVAGDGLISSLGARVERVSAHGGFLTLSVPPGAEHEAIATLLADPAVESAELNALRQPARIPVDDQFPRQWNMEMIGAPAAWDVSQGAGITIAVIDTGVAYENYTKFGRSPELSQAFFVFPYDATDDTTHANDEDGHGTHVTGTLVQDWDAYGVAGLVPKSAIMPVRVCLAHGCPADAIAEGVYWAVDHGADVINLSLGGPVESQAERQAFAYAEAHDVVVVAASGNGGGDLIGDPYLEYPARLETVISVGAVDRLKNRERYSSYGSHEGTAGVHVMAPGGNTHQDLDGDGYNDGILQSTYAFACGDEPEGFKTFKLCSYYGTSMATPHVTGVAAMLLSEYRDLTAAQVREVIACSAQDLGVPGNDLTTGAGLIDAPAALSDADGNDIVDCLEPPPPFSLSIEKVKVRPGGTVRVALDLSTPSPGASGYEVQVSFDREVVHAVSCQPRQETECTLGEDTVRVTGAPEAPLFGKHRPAYIEFEAVGPADSTSALQADVTAASAREPDIGFQFALSDGSVTITDPPPTVAGDLNCDTFVGSKDVIAALRTLVGAAPALCADQGDVNCSGAVDSHDALAIVAHLAEIAQPLVASCPLIGSALEDPLPGNAALTP